MAIKLIATDLDDTLMRPDKSISSYTAAVLRRCRERGVLTCFITARSQKACERAVSLVSPDYTVTCGGGLCLYRDEILSQTSLSKAEANAIINYCMKLSSVQRFQTDTVSGSYLVSYTPSPNGDYSHASLYNFKNGVPCDVYKLVISISDPDERRRLAAAFPNARIYNYIGGTTCFIAAKEATKLRGLKFVAAHMGIELADIAAFGDDIGDVDYLCACGYGVAVENSVDAARRAARYVCGTNAADGVAHWLEEHVL